MRSAQSADCPFVPFLWMPRLPKTRREIPPDRFTSGLVIAFPPNHLSPSAESSIGAGLLRETLKEIVFV
jgi:hypothetical protein